MAKIIRVFDNVTNQKAGILADESSLEISGTSLRVKALGVTDAMLAGSISFSKLADNANIARLDQSENVAAVWSFGSNIPTVSADPSTDNQLTRRSWVLSQIAATGQSSEWQDSCLTKGSTPPGSPVTNGRYLVTSAGSDALTAVVTGTKTFTVAGDQTANYAADDKILVRGSTGNDGYYTVVSATFSVDHTDIVVTEVIADATVDGTIYFAAGAYSQMGVDVIARYTGSAWVIAAVPTVGTFTDLDDEASKLYYYGGVASGWTAKSFESTTAGDGIELSGTAVTVKLDGGTLSKSGTGLKIASSSITDTEINAISISKITNLQTSLNSKQDAQGTKTNGHGSSITEHQLVYVKADGNVALAKADAWGTVNGMYFVKDTTIADTEAGAFYAAGAVVPGFSGLTPGALYFVSADTAGAITATGPTATTTIRKCIGYAISATELYFSPEEGEVNP